MPLIPLARKVAAFTKGIDPVLQHGRPTLDIFACTHRLNRAIRVVLLPGGVVIGVSSPPEAMTEREL
jgi:hypothetical protein